MDARQDEYDPESIHLIVYRPDSIQTLIVYRPMKAAAKFSLAARFGTGFGSMNKKSRL